MSEIQKTKKVWLAIGNTDCTEGRGRPLIKYVCESKSTAVRLGANGSVQGSNCAIKESTAVMFDSQWLVPGHIEKASEDDQILQKKQDKRDTVIKRIKESGITDEELKSLGIK